MSRLPGVVLLLCGAISGAMAGTHLTMDEYGATFSGPSTKLDVTTYDVRQVWKYVREVPNADYAGFEICWGYIPFVYRTGDKRFDHVHVSTRTQNVFLMVIVENESGQVFGHTLLNLNTEYNLGSPKQLSRSCAPSP